LIRAALEHAHYQESRLTELSHQEFPFTDSKQLVQILLKIHAKIIDRLDILLSESTEGTSQSIRQDAVLAATRFGYLLAFLHTALEPLEFSSRTHVSQGTVTLLRSLMTKRGERRRFILMPAYEYNYSYTDVMSHILRATRQALGESGLELDEDAESIAVLSYPNIYRENVLANCLLGHEIGHFVAEQSQLVGKIMAKIQLDSSLLQVLIDETKKRK
jgi:hypothetical protein